MEVPVMERFCVLFKLKTGCIIMGFLNMIFTLTLAIVMISFALDLKEHSPVEPMNDTGEEDVMASMVFTISVVLIVLLIIKFLLDLIFVFAVIQTVRLVLTHFCIFWGMFVIFYTVGFLKIMFHMGISHGITQMLYLAENFYYIIVIRSYLIYIEEE